MKAKLKKVNEQALLKGFMMSSLLKSLRCSFASVTAGVALAAGIGTAQAGPIFTTPGFEGALPQQCSPLDDGSPIIRGPFDKTVRDTLKNLQAYSRLPALLEDAKRAGMEIKGVCPNFDNPANGMVGYDPQTKALLINMADPSSESPAPMNAETVDAFTEMGYLSFTSEIISELAQATAKDKQNPLFKPTQDFDTLMLLGTTLTANAMAEKILFAVEAAGEDNRLSEVNHLYRKYPRLIGEISDMHALALAAKTQNRTLTDQERNTFRNNILAVFLKDKTMRTMSAQMSLAQMANVTLQKMVMDKQAGRPMTPLTHSAATESDIANLLSRYPGNQAQSLAVKTYKEYWRSQPDDPAAELREHVPKLPEYARDEIEKQGNTLKPQPQLRFNF